MIIKYPHIIIAPKALKHFGSVPKTRSQARKLFMDYISTRMFYQMRMREQDGTSPVHVPANEIETRFFRSPRFNRKYEIQWLVDAGELQVTVQTKENGLKKFYYKALQEGDLDFSLLKRQSRPLDELTSRMRDYLMEVDLLPKAPSTPYFNAFLSLRYQYLDLYFIVDQFSGRVHTPVSNFHRTHRPNILLAGEATASFDVTTMQPLLLGKILKERIGPNEFSSWITAGEDIYTILQNKSGLKTRDQGKKRFFEILFSKPNCKLEQLFGSSNWIQWINEYKSQPEKSNPHTVEKQHSNLAWLLQTTEVSFMRKVWEQLAVRNIKFLSVHDEIIVRESDSENAKEIFHEQLEQHFEYFKLNSKENNQIHC
jgi:hypothetical protein